jgi:hypothetical protein
MRKGYVNDRLYRVIFIFTISIGLAASQPASAQTQDQNRETGAEFGPLSFTEPGQTKSASIASKPILRVNRMPPYKRLFGNISRIPGNSNSRRFHPIDDGLDSGITSFDSPSTYFAEPKEWSFVDPGLHVMTTALDGPLSKPLNLPNKDLSSYYNARIEGTSAFSGNDDTVRSGDWTPAKIDLYSNGGFGIRAPSGIIDMPPPNGHVEETF